MTRNKNVCTRSRAFADLHGCAELKEQAEKFAETHFAEVLDCDEVKYS